jgi:hypothetical protein
MKHTKHFHPFKLRTSVSGSAHGYYPLCVSAASDKLAGNQDFCLSNADGVGNTGATTWSNYRGNGTTTYGGAAFTS